MALLRHLLTSAVLMLVLLSVNAQDQFLVAHYPLDGDANDISTYGNHGEVHGAVPTTDRFGLENQALDFSPQNQAYISIPHTNQISLDQEYTISLWFYYRNQSTGQYFTLAEKSNPDAGGHSRYGMWVYNGGVITVCAEEDPCPSLCQRCADSQTRLATDEWHHIAGTYDGQTFRIYINGVLDVERAFNTKKGISQTSYELFLGTDRYGEAIYLNGVLDDFRLYNRALTETQVQNLFRGQSVSTQSIQDDDAISLFPTIAENNQVSIVSESRNLTSYTLYSSSGHQLMHQSIGAVDGFSLSTSSLTNGHYVVIIELDNGQLVRKRFTVSR